MKIALVLQPAWSTDTAPLGLAAVAAVLRRAGHEVRVFDQNVTLWRKFRHLYDDPWHSGNALLWRYEQEFEKKIYPYLREDITACMREVADWGPEVAGFSLYDTSVHCTRRASEALRALLPDIRIVYGGPGVKRQNLEYFREFERNALDIAVIGEGEATAVELMQRLERGESLRGCLGIAYRGPDGLTVYESTRPNIDLKELPLPYFGDFCLDLYESRRLPVMMSRGCTAKCTFCAETRFWSILRYRDAQDILGEFLNNN
jgi:radical SAM superfamily enzyme YgiQ (UPF0313 family)